MQSLKARLAARTNIKLLSAALYLKHGKNFGSKVKNIGVRLDSKGQAANTAKKLYERMFSSGTQDSGEYQNAPSDPEEAVEPTGTLSDRLNKMIQEARELDDNSVDKHKTNFTKELSLFELNIGRTSNVSKVHEALKTVVPTSVEAERTFSAAGLFITKIR